MSVKVRIAPSPTGNLHVGTAQSGLFNWLFSKKTHGQFNIRIEDTDEERSKKEYEINILEGFNWLGLNNDGPITRSSENKAKYRNYLEKLMDSKKAFWCNHSKDELEAEQKMQSSRKEAPRHICSDKEKKLTSGQVIRLAVDETSDREIVFEDIIRGRVAFKESLLGDFSIARNLDSALYHFAVVIDDIEMGITNIIRGEDHLSNTPKHILIYEALGVNLPRFAHLPLLLASDRSKLSKRDGAVSLSEYQKDYLPEALINFLGALSYTFSKEIMTKEEMIQEFELAKVHKSGAIFDTKKLNWLNSQYIRKMPWREFAHLINHDELNEEAIKIITERLERMSDADSFNYLWQEPYYQKELLNWKDQTLEKSKMTLMESKIIFTESEMGQDVLKMALDKLGERLDNRGVVYWPLRVALSGREKSPDPVSIALAIGREKTLERIDKAVSLI